MITVSRVGKGLVAAKLKVLVDDQEIGVLKYNESKSFDVAPGLHKLSIKMDWEQSNVIEFTAEPDQDLKFNSTIALRTVKNFKDVLNFLKKPRYNHPVILEQVK